MAQKGGQSLYREKALNKISTPDRLSEYLRVTNPSVWIILAAVLLLLIGLFVWAANATIETTISAQVSFNKGIGTVVTSGFGSGNLEEGETIRIGNRTLKIDTVSTDEMGRVRAHVFSDMPDGTYNATVVLSSYHPLDFLLDRR